VGVSSIEPPIRRPRRSTFQNPVVRPTRSFTGQSCFLPRMRRVTTQAAFAESLMAAEGRSIEALCVVSDALGLVFASHSLAFCSAAKRAASTGIPSIRIIVESSCKQTREKCLGRLSLARPVRPIVISVAWAVPRGDSGGCSPVLTLIISSLATRSSTYAFSSMRSRSAFTRACRAAAIPTGITGGPRPVGTGARDHLRQQ
jgi:hypothetical protein